MTFRHILCSFSSDPVLLGVFSVDGPVHSHGGLQMVQPTADTDTVGESSQGSGAEAGGA